MRALRERTVEAPLADEADGGAPSGDLDEVLAELTAEAAAELEAQGFAAHEIEVTSGART